jgi:hypothetical protein
VVVLETQNSKQKNSFETLETKNKLDVRETPPYIMEKLFWQK